MQMNREIVWLPLGFVALATEWYTFRSQQSFRQDEEEEAERWLSDRREREEEWWEIWKWISWYDVHEGFWKKQKSHRPVGLGGRMTLTE